MLMCDGIVEASGNWIGTNWASGSGDLKHLLLLINAQIESQPFRLPIGVVWRELLTTAQPIEGARYENEVTLDGRSLILLASQP
jgi:hypothetical protein